ncbi:cytochrome P450 [Stereum hirsutum FP-91666 SS1]|uniref:cytochrome P450 n=1 Tax=Stereum hirsutum (strain FP-91666) TaxID=721885 RepID=UPI00044492FD|nr:cytochrome P450 [Stereum hirsutum FP-91666 SS1]EIM84314.1 cytochrome P450 [Stereum hirsutum FP-91666 SS1]
MAPLSILNDHLHTSFTASLFSLSVLAGLYIWRRRNAKYAGKQLPPGPPRLPIIGNLLQMPKDHEWLVYEKWAKETGSELVHCDVLGSHIVVVNSAKAANEIFVKRSAIYSDRPFIPSFSVLLGFNWVVATFPYGDRLKAARKAFHAFFQPSAVKDYRPIECTATHQLLRHLVHKPADFKEHLRHMAGAIILDIAYGIKVKPQHDPFIETAEGGLEAVTTIASIEAQIFDLFPALLKLPSWFPGVGYKKKASELCHWSKDMLNHPFEATKDSLASGTASPSVAATLITQLESKKSLPEDEGVAKGLTANMYIGGADTTVCALENFFLAMALCPEAQRKAQAEIDSVIGNDRLPEFSDIDTLPYVKALTEEVWRWRIVGPLGFPHKLTEDDVFGDYFIPKGSTVIGNIWAILHDESVYGPDANDFNPDRYLNNPDLPEPEAVFGFGRRICPGRFMARESVWLAVASILATLKIEKAVDDQGKEIEPVDDHMSGIVAYPLPFKCNVKPRSLTAEKLIMATEVFDSD